MQSYHHTAIYTHLVSGTGTWNTPEALTSLLNAERDVGGRLRSSIAHTDSYQAPGMLLQRSTGVFLRVHTRNVLRENLNAVRLTRKVASRRPVSSRWRQTCRGPALGGKRVCVLRRFFSWRGDAAVSCGERAARPRGGICEVPTPYPVIRFELYTKP